MMNVKQFEEKIKDATTVLLNKERLEFFGLLFSKLEKELIQQEHLPAFGLNAENVLGGLTDGKKIYFVTDDEKSYKHLLFIAMHEIIHIVSGHVQRAGTRDPSLWAIAADHVTNRLLKEIEETTNAIQFPDGCIFLEDVHASNPNVSVEELYTMLSSQQQQNSPPKQEQQKDDNRQQEGNEETSDNGSPQQPQGQDSQTSETQETNNVEEQQNEATNQESNQDGDNNSGTPDSDSQSVPSNTSSSQVGKYTVTTQTTENGVTYVQVKDNQTGQTMQSVVDTNAESQFMENAEESEEGSPVEKAIDELQDFGKMAWNSSVFPGTNEDPMVQYLNKILKIEIPWEEVLETAVKYPVQDTTGRTWTWPNFYIRRAKVPGDYQDDRVGLLVAAIDVSGSIALPVLEKFAGVLIHCASYYKKLIIYTHSISVTGQFEFDVEEGSDAIEKDIVNTLKSIVGRGGTSHRDVFDKIELLNDEEEISSIVFLTDFYSNVQGIYNKYKFLKEHTTIWLIDGEEKVELPGCNTKVIRIN